MAGLRPAAGILAAAVGDQRGDGGVVRGVRVRVRLRRTHGQVPAETGATRLSGRRRLPADEQGVEPAVLSLAGAARGAGAPAPPNTSGLDDGRRVGLGSADAVPVRRAEDGPAPAVVHDDRTA